MSDTKRTRRTDEPPTRDGAPLAGWPAVITAEEAVALRGALGQLQAALDAVVRERDEARAEGGRLRAERDTLLLDARDFLRWFNRHHPDPSSNPDHPWCALNDRLNAHADVLATFDSGVETKEAKP
jgi:hypothetical protein